MSCKFLLQKWIILLPVLFSELKKKKYGTVPVPYRSFYWNWIKSERKYFQKKKREIVELRYRTTDCTGSCSTSFFIVVFSDLIEMKYRTICLYVRTYFLGHFDNNIFYNIFTFNYSLFYLKRVAVQFLYIYGYILRIFVNYSIFFFEIFRFTFLQTMTSSCDTYRTYVLVIMFYFSICGIIRVRCQYSKLISLWLARRYRT